jgi:hypothetical protein
LLAEGFGFILDNDLQSFLIDIILYSVVLVWILFNLYVFYRYPYSDSRINVGQLQPRIKTVYSLGLPHYLTHNTLLSLFSKVSGGKRTELFGEEFREIMKTVSTAS